MAPPATGYTGRMTDGSTDGTVMPSGEIADGGMTGEEQDALTRFAEMVRGMHFSMLTTVAAEGTLRSRPMSTQDQSTDGTLWFLVAASSGAAEDLESRPEVNLSFSSPDEQRWVSVSGTASITDDRARIRELWNPLYEAWFPNGPGDPNVRVVRVEIGDIHHWDAPSSRMVQLRSR
jgi:general stress protein 26